MTLARVRLLLMDPSSMIWADTDLQAAIRLALQEINLVSGKQHTLNGLDSATLTTFTAEHDPVIVAGAAAYAALARAVDRAENYELANEEEEVKTAAEKLMSKFTGMLGKLYPSNQARTGKLKAGVRGPWGSWADDFGEKDSS
jgi:hypothetical protein